MMKQRRQHWNYYFDLKSCCFVCVGHAALSHGHFPAAPVIRCRERVSFQCITPSGSWESSPSYHWTTCSGRYCVLVSLVSARDGLRISRGMRTLQRIYLYKLARKAIRPFAVASSKACDVASIGTVTNVIYGFLRSSSKPCNERSGKKAKLR